MIKVSIHAPARGATLFAGAAESDTRVDCVQYFLQKERKPYLILDARYERVRENGVIRQQAVMIAIGVTENGIREIIYDSDSSNQAKIPRIAVNTGPAGPVYSFPQPQA